VQLIEEGRQMVAQGMSKRQAAAKLAPKAEDGTVDQTIKRALGPEILGCHIFWSAKSFPAAQSP
jgi:hypothetical protein